MAQGQHWISAILQKNIKFYERKRETIETGKYLPTLEFEGEVA